MTADAATTALAATAAAAAAAAAVAMVHRLNSTIRRQSQTDQPRTTVSVDYRRLQVEVCV